MALPPAAGAVVEAHRETTEELRRRVVDHLDALWHGTADYRDEAMARWAADAIAAMEGAQAQMAALTDAYVSSFEAVVTGGSVAGPMGIDPATVTTEALRGVPAVEVWARPAHTVWTTLAQGADLATAIERGWQRAQDLAETDLQLAHTHAARQAMEARRTVTGHRRSPRSSGACALCLVAATQRYRRADLARIHPGCHCVVVPIIGTADPGPLLDAGQLDAVHRAVAAHTGRPVDRSGREVDYRNLVVEVDHGEIGRVLARRGHRHTTPSEVR